MAIRGNTFHDSWFKVANLKPYLHVSLKIYRQVYRNKVWHVLEDPANNQFFRINKQAYQFISLLNGKYTVDEAWNICLEEFEDEAPTQGEAISLLGRLYSSNLLLGDTPSDSDELLKRHAKRKQQENQAKVKSILFARFPLFDPDDILNRCNFILGKVFSRVGYLLGILILFVGIYFFFSNFQKIAISTTKSISLDNLPWLYLTFILVKVFHEFAHGCACKYYGKNAGSSGEVRVFGIAFIFFTPVPYVDASSSWSLKSKWQKALVALAGIYIELLIAAIACIVWTQTGNDTLIHNLAFNAMLVCTISSLAFNGNPLLKYDAYYVLSDMLEIPNLDGRSKLYLKYIFRKYLYGVKKSRSGAYSSREAFHFFWYSVSSLIYRLLLAFVIIKMAFTINELLGFAALLLYLYTYCIKSVFKHLYYVFTSHELIPTRFRAVSITLAFYLIIFSGIFLVRINDTAIVRGVVMIPAEDYRIIFPKVAGSLVYMKPLESVEKNELVFKLENQGLKEELLSIENKISLNKLEQKIARRNNKIKDVYNLENKLLSLESKKRLLERQIASLEFYSPIKGHFIPDDEAKIAGNYLDYSKKIGSLIDLNKKTIICVIPQEKNRLLKLCEERVEVRINGAFEEQFYAKFSKKGDVSDIATTSLISNALALEGGGDIETFNDNGVIKSKQGLFEIKLKISDEKYKDILKVGQVVYVKFTMPKKTLYDLMKEKAQRLFINKFL